jgi:hypothetical protein
MGGMNQFEVDDDLFQKKEDFNGAFPHLWLSSQNWSGGSVGRNEGINSFA